MTTTHEAAESTGRAAEGTAKTPSSPRRRLRMGNILEAYAMVFLIGAIALFFSLHPATRETFPTMVNLQAILANQSVVAIVALAALLPLVCNEWDLSVGAVCGLSAVVTAMAMSDGQPVPLAILVGVGVGVLIGTTNALLVTRAKVNAVIVTLGIATVLAGVVNHITGGMAIVSNIPLSVREFGSNVWLGIPLVTFAAAIFALGVYYVLDHTPVGRYLYALGSNPTAARLAGLRVRLLLASTFVVGGLLAAFAGFIQVARAGAADPRLGDSLTLPALAAAFLSAAAIKPGRYNVWGTIVALLFLATLNSGLNLYGAPPYVNSYVNGAALVVGVGIASFLGRRRSGKS